MNDRSRLVVFSLVMLIATAQAPAAEIETLPGTKPLTMEGDRSVQMVAGIDKFLMSQIEQSIQERQKLWKRDFSSAAAYEKSIAANRERLRKYIGAVDPRAKVTALEYVATTSVPARVAETDAYTVFAVRWPVFTNVHGEGLLLQPKGKSRGGVVALPDADQTPEMIVGLAAGVAPASQFARRLAESGFTVLVPTLVDRQDTWSGNPSVRMTNQPHREWIYRQAFEMGRHIIGYEVQKVLGAVDWFASQAGQEPATIGVVGYGEGGLIALYSAALDPRIDAALVSGYFDSRQRVWEEPIYRNVFALLQEFGDAELASLIAPRSLTVEFSAPPTVDGPPAPRDGRGGAAPGKIGTPTYYSVKGEVDRANGLTGQAKFNRPVKLIAGNGDSLVEPGSAPALTSFVEALTGGKADLKELATAPDELRKNFDPAMRQYRQVKDLEEHTQQLLRFSEGVRAKFWSKAKPTSLDGWQAACKDYKAYLWDEVIGRFPAATLPPNVRTRKIYDKPTWTGYEVMIDVWPEVYSWGYLLVPKDIKAGEKRPVVVCQHGLEGVPEDVVTDDPKSTGFQYYQAFAARLAERGFVTYAPHNPYRGKDEFRVLQRKANPLKKSLFSVILGQHDRMLDWLSELPFVDPARIGFYGLSYGGKTAVRVPPLLDRYALSICSADYDEWIKKNVTVDSGYSYMMTGEYEMFEFDLGHTFNYGDMASMMVPRPFMVERGHTDGVAPDEWVAHEYAKVRRNYAFLGIPEKTTIEYFNGPHMIHGVGTYEFLHKHLNWPKRDAKQEAKN